MSKERNIRIWLWAGVVMVFVQISLGGITRLTGSGLSITQWDIVTGIIPPLNQEQWTIKFELYKRTPQYQKINEGMSLKEFKFIYFWEYMHRLWARSIGFVFVFPFVFFLSKGWLSGKLLKNLGIAVLLGGIVATLGWIMVASGLVDRPWVNAYKLTIHLNLAFLLYSWLLWIAIGPPVSWSNHNWLKPLLNVLTVLVILQLILGGLMSGMKAGLYYPTWPDMYGALFPTNLLQAKLWTRHFLFEAYEQGPMPGVVQFLHRMTAYVIGLFSIIIFWKSRINSTTRQIRMASFLLIVSVLVQITLGVLTVIHCIGKVPLLYGVAHQIMAIVALSVIVYLQRQIRR